MEIYFLINYIHLAKFKKIKKKRKKDPNKEHMSAE